MGVGVVVRFVVVVIVVFFVTILFVNDEREFHPSTENLRFDFILMTSIPMKLLTTPKREMLRNEERTMSKATRSRSLR